MDTYSREKMDEAAYEPHMLAFLKAAYAHIKSTWGVESFVQHIADEPVKANTESWLALALIERIRNELAYDALTYTRNDAEFLAAHDEAGDLIEALNEDTPA